MNNNTRLFLLLKSKFNLCTSFCTESTKVKKIGSRRVSHKNAMNKFFLENEHLATLKQYIPKQYLTLRRAKTPENLYLICPKIAKMIASYIKIDAKLNKESQIVAETNAGLGLITAELLENGVSPIRLYESCPDFRCELKDFGAVYPGQVELFTKDIFHLNRYSFMDKQDRGNRVEQLLKNVPKRNWSDEPVMTIVGAMPTLSFLKYLIKCLCLQTDIATYGRIKIFAVMRPSHYAILKSTPEDNLLAYQYWTTLFSLLFDYELLEKIPRNVFLPWESPPSKVVMNRYPANLDPEKLYLVKICIKKELPVSAEFLLPLFYFGRHFYGTGTNNVIPTIEKWMPGCGLNILLPKLTHTEYFEDINIYTQFRELTPIQLLAVFKELVNYPSYPGSSFIAMIENNLLKSETVESDMAEVALVKNVAEDIEQQLDPE